MKNPFETLIKENEDATTREIEDVKENSQKKGKLGFSRKENSFLLERNAIS